MGNSVQIRVTGDLSGIHEAVGVWLPDEFGKAGHAAEEAFQGASAGARSLDRNLLSNRESTRLLIEEMGVHMPRAVTGAVAEMLPAINTVGPALLAAFAVKELWEFEKALTALYADFDGVTQAEKEMATYAKENQAALEGMARASTQVARTELHRLQMQAAVAAAHVNELQKEKDNLTATFGVADAVFSKVIGLTGEYNDAQEEAIRLQGLATEMAKIYSDDVAGDYKKASKAAEEATDKEHKYWATLIKEEKEYYTYWFKARKEAGEQLATDEKARGAAAEHQEFLAKQQLLDLEQKLSAVNVMTYGQLRMLVPQITTEANATRHLTAVYSDYLLVKQDVLKVGRAFTQALKVEVDAVNNDMLGSMKNLAAGAIALTGSQKAAAAFKVGYEIAEGIACLASGTWPPNPAALIASGLHFEAATQYALTSGGGGGRAGGGSTATGSSANTGGNQSRYGGGPGGGGPGGGSGGLNMTLNWHQYGPTGNMADFARTLSAVQSTLVGQGQIKLVASNALTNGPKQT